MSDEQWYWSLTEKRAVRAEERGPADEVLGPYPTEEDAINWKEKADSRNEAWEQADKEWEGVDDDE